jgi:DHA1 family tetracycline resistance protein-like MFS transporter
MAVAKANKISLSVLLMVAFIDFMGLGLIYPIFSKLLFDTNAAFFSSGTNNEIRGVWLGILFCLMPLVQFFFLPFWGAVSDEKGRRKPLLLSLSFSVVGHLISIFGILFSSIFLLVISRIILGIGAANTSIVQASIADISNNHNKAKNFGLFAMAIGAGFTFGPLIGGSMAIYGYHLPFTFACCLTFINLVLAFGFYKETLKEKIKKTFSFVAGIKNLKMSWTNKSLRMFFLCSFLMGFAWTYFLEFSPVYLIKNFNFTAAQIGFFYAAMGGFYALSSGVLIRPFLSRYKPELLIFFSCLLGGLSILSVLLYNNYYWLLPFAVFNTYVVAFFSPNVMAIISNNAAKDVQGEALGVWGSVNNMAQTISALSAGWFIGLNPSFSLYVGGIVMIIAAIIILAFFGKKLFY